MRIDINITAGEILLLLEEEKRQMSLMEMKYRLRKSISLINLAVGRLLREGLIDIETRSNNYRVSRNSCDESKVRKDFLLQAKRNRIHELINRSAKNLLKSSSKLAIVGG